MDINQELISGENGCEWLSDYLFNYFIYGNLDAYDGDKDFYRQFCNEVKITPDLLQREVSFVCNNSLKSHPSANIDFVTEKILAIMSLLFNVEFKTLCIQVSKYFSTLYTGTTIATSVITFYLFNFFNFLYSFQTPLTPSTAS